MEKLYNLICNFSKYNLKDFSDEEKEEILNKVEERAIKELGEEQYKKLESFYSINFRNLSLYMLTEVEFSSLSAKMRRDSPEVSLENEIILGTKVCSSIFKVLEKKNYNLVDALFNVDPYDYM